MAVAYAQINPANLRWARERAQLSEATLAKKLNVDEDKLIAWEEGEKKVTFKQAQDFAKQTLTPFGYLFLAIEPVETLPIPDLRTIASNQPAKPSAELIKIVQIILERQQWYKDYLKTEQAQERNDYVGRFNTRHSYSAIVENMRQTLKVGAHPNRGNWEDYFRDLIKRIENVGVLVMRQGDVGHHTKPLSVQEFRGFALYDPLAPVIFINNADAPSARLFTLIHELAHIWIGQSGVSDANPVTHRNEEKLCNAVAAEFLVPAQEFLDAWQNFEDWKQNLPALEARFHVSKWVIARRALTLNKISQQEYGRFVDAVQREHKERVRKGKGPGYFITRKSQVGTRFAEAIVAEALSGRTLLRDAGQLLGMAPNKIKSFATELGI